MLDRDINWAIARHLGYIAQMREIHHSGGYQWTERVTEYLTPNGKIVPNIPQFVSDLNQMHIAEQSLSAEQLKTYRRHLSCGAINAQALLCHATAQDRAKAFIKTI